MKKIMLISGIACALALTACSTTKSDKKEGGTAMKTEDKANMAQTKDMKDMPHLKNLNGKPVNLSAYKGKKVYVKFWASWCPICLGGLQDVQDLATSKQDFTVLTVVAPNVNGEKNEQDFIQWFKGLHMDKLPVLIDEGGSLTKSLKVRGYPTSAFYDTKGKLVKEQPGQVDNDAIIKTMSSIN